MKHIILTIIYNFDEQNCNILDKSVQFVFKWRL